MILKIIEQLEDTTRVTVFTGQNTFTGDHASVGYGEDPRNPGTADSDQEYVIVRTAGYVDCWIPVDTITSIEIYTKEDS